MNSGDIVREQFSALQKQQRERLNQLQGKPTKKNVITADVCRHVLDDLFSFD
jgi:hypothetical protein